MTNPSALTNDELTNIREYVFLLLLLELIEKNTRELNYTSSSLKPLYLLSAEALHKKVHDDVVALKKFFRERKIKVEEDDSSDRNFALRYVVYYRGYQEKFPIVKDIIKGELGIRLGKYINALGRELNAK
jgi:hypothetical protein